MAEACIALDVPVIGGNVSLYNESHGVSIDPTPVVGVLGVIESLQHAPPLPRFVQGGRLMLLGDADLTLAGSRYAFERGQRGGSLTPPDWDAIHALQRLLIDLVGADLLVGVHDISEGGLGVALAEMAVRSGIGCRVARVPDGVALMAESDGDDQLKRLGVAMGDEISIKGVCKMSLSEATKSWENCLPDALGAGNLASE